MKIFALCGSLRKESSNWKILNAAKSYLHQHEWQFADLSLLPYFDPDLQYSEETPEIVLRTRKQAGASDVIVISTPEYAHGIPGMLKNGLEWIFNESTMQKPVFVIIGSAQGQRVRDQLLEVLKTMDFKIENESFLLFQGARTKFNSTNQITDANTKKQFEGFLDKIQV